MPAVLHDECKPEILQVYLDSRESSLRLRLFKNDLTPTRDMSLGSFTEADFSGYAQATPAFPDATLDGDEEGSSQASAVTFTHNGGGTSNSVYGWYLYDTTSLVVVFSARFALPISLGINGDYVSIVLPLKLKQAA